MVSRIVPILISPSPKDASSRVSYRKSSHWVRMSSPGRGAKAREREAGLDGKHELLPTYTWGFLKIRGAILGILMIRTLEYWGPVVWESADDLYTCIHIYICM